MDSMWAEMYEAAKTILKSRCTWTRFLKDKNLGA